MAFVSAQEISVPVDRAKAVAHRAAREGNARLFIAAQLARAQGIKLACGGDARIARNRVRSLKRDGKAVWTFWNKNDGRLSHPHYEIKLFTTRGVKAAKIIAKRKENSGFILTFVKTSNITNDNALEVVTELLRKHKELRSSPPKITHYLTLNSAHVSYLGRKTMRDLWSRDVEVMNNARIRACSNYEIHSCPAPEDRSDPRLWHLDAGDTRKLGKEPSSPPRVIIFDSGWDPSHKEFDGVTRDSVTFVSCDGKTPMVAEPKDYDSLSAHGTQIASLIIGRTVGVAPHSKLTVAAVLTDISDGVASGRIAQLLAAVDWLNRHHAEDKGVVVVCAFEVSGLKGTYDRGSGDPVFDQLLRREGSTAFVAAGNGTISEFATDPSAIAVGAITISGGVWKHSANSQKTDRVPCPDIHAPGVDIIVPFKGRAKYGKSSGTSLATAISAGLAARLHPSHVGDKNEMVRELRGTKGIR